MGTHQLIKHFPKSIRQNFWDFLYKHVAQWDSLKDTSGLSTLGVSSRKVELTHFNCFTLRKKFETALHTSCLMIPQQTWKKKVGGHWIRRDRGLSPSYQQPAGGTGVIQETNGSQLFSRFSRRCAADWVQDTTIVRTVCYQVNGGLWLEPITNWKSTSAGRRMRAPVVAVLNERRVSFPRPGNLKCGPDLRFSPTVLLVTHSK